MFVAAFTFFIQLAFLEDISTIRFTWPPLGEKIFHALSEMPPPAEESIVVPPPVSFAKEVLGPAPGFAAAIRACFGITVASSMVGVLDSPQNGPNRESRGIDSVEKTPIS